MPAWMAVGAAYLLGGICTGYYLVRLWKGIDLRTVGSGSAGGTNAARVLGAWARPVVGGLDALKGAVAVGVAHWVGLDIAATGAVALAVVVGHVFPVQLGFRGGKGIGTSLGAFCVYFPLAAVAIAVLTALLYAFTRRQQVSGVLAYAITGLTVYWWSPSVAVTRAVVAITLTVIFANRGNFMKDLRASTLD